MQTQEPGTCCMTEGAHAQASMANQGADIDYGACGDRTCSLSFSHSQVQEMIVKHTETLVERAPSVTVSSTNAVPQTKVSMDDMSVVVVVFLDDATYAMPALLLN